MECPFCRAELRDGDRTTHEASCSARRWWLDNFGHLSRPEPPAPEAPPIPLSVCRFCGYAFELAESGRHERECGQRRWVLLNFERHGQRPTPRPPPLPQPAVPSEALIAKLRGWIAGEGERLEQVRWVVSSLTSVRDDDTYTRAHAGALALLSMWSSLSGARSPVERKIAESALPIVLGTGDRLAKLALDIEADLDHLQALGPARTARELAYLEDHGGDPREVEAKRARLSEVDALELVVEDKKHGLAELSRRLVDMEHSVRSAAAGQGAEELARVLSARAAGPDGGLRRPPRRVPPARGSRGRGLPARTVEPHAGPKAPPATAGEGWNAPPTAPARAEAEAGDAGGGPPPEHEHTSARPISLDAATFDRLAPERLELARVKTIGAYRIVGLLGAGGMGIVYEARSPSGRRVALKTVRLTEETTWDDGRLRRFQRECRILQTLDHPGCVRLLDSGEDDGEVYVVLSIVDGIPLSALLRERALTLPETLGLGVELAVALQYLHDHGIVHRDLKPANVMIDRGGSVIITDFGIARAADDTAITSSSDVIGTPGYVAPEIVLGEDASPAADQWALGRLLLRAAAGPRARPPPRAREPFRSRMEAGTLIDWTELPAARDWAPLRAVLERALEVRPERRFPDLLAVREALHGLGHEPVLPASPLAPS